MSAETIINALQPYKIRPNGRDRYRAICPCCGERNPNTLSVGVTAEGAVLVRCFKLQCSVGSICAALGLEVADLFPPRESQGAPLQRRRLISPAQALDLLHDESQLVAVVAANIGHGTSIDDEDRARVLQAAGRIAYLRAEVLA
ncbi:MAG: hypothetical protein H0W40_10715 [Methylibium sp.]|uniref:hypothetical protein n=1 Tax=Methylibium sp. TaxID=2067992 RepID=UPI0018580454|nr:hypothetical protein [Methylibium sp.]MBA3597831.1 hypothetical protein [Methylibium sp.]